MAQCKPDTLDGGSAGNDILFGYAGDDTLIGSAGVDQLFGEDDNDLIYRDPGDNLANVLGGSGTDTLVFMSATAPVSFSLTGHEFEAALQDLTDTTGQSRNTITRNYNANWQLGNEVGTNDGLTSWLTDII